MSDLISRQAAIEALVKRAHLSWEYLKIINPILDVFEELPSAQTEPQWIPCSERLPEEIGTYMTTLNYGTFGLAVGQRFYHGGVLGWEDDCVIAWMPLPEPYKEADE